MYKDSQKPVLEFNDVERQGDSRLVSDLRSVNVSMAASYLAVILQDEYSDKLPICDLASGLDDPSKGFVKFLGKDWQKMSPFSQSAMRAKTGRIFESSAWISSMSVYDNIVLAERHNTTRSDSDIRSEVMKLAEYIDLNDIPAGRPDGNKPDELRKCEIIRAFLGKPLLLLMESPESGLPLESVPFFRRLLEKALARGAAAIWITQSETIWNSIDLANTTKYRKIDNRIEIKGEQRDA